MKYLVMTTRLPQFDQQEIPAHYRFLDGLREGELLEQAGPFTDSTGGAYVLKAGSLDEARHLAEQDPLYIKNCSKITVYEWDAS